MTLHDLRLQVHPGHGLVANLGTATVVLPEDTEHREFADGLLDIVRSGCEHYGPTPGRPVIRKLAGLVMGAEPAEVAPFAVVADADDGLAIMLCGSMELELTTDSGDEALSGREVATWVDRVVRAPVHRLALYPTGGLPGRLHADVDLRLGVVLGSGMTLSPAGTVGDRPAPARLEQPPVQAVPDQPQPAPTRARSRAAAAPPHRLASHAAGRQPHLSPRAHPGTRRTASPPGPVLPPLAAPSQGELQGVELCFNRP